MADLKQLEKVLEDAAAALGEHFDAIQIVASVQEEGVTRCLKRGTGNYYARESMCREFCEQTQATTLAEEIDRVGKKDED